MYHVSYLRYSAANVPTCSLPLCVCHVRTLVRATPPQNVAVLQLFDSFDQVVLLSNDGHDGFLSGTTRNTAHPSKINGVGAVSKPCVCVYVDCRGLQFWLPQSVLVWVQYLPSNQGVLENWMIPQDYHDASNEVLESRILVVRQRMYEEPNIYTYICIYVFGLRAAATTSHFVHLQ